MPGIDMSKEEKDKLINQIIEYNFEELLKDPEQRQVLQTAMEHYLKTGTNMLTAIWDDAGKKIILKIVN